MNTEKLNNLNPDEYVKISTTELSEILAVSKIILEKDTFISDKIRIAEIDNNIFIQETTNRDEILVRRMNDLDSAIKLIDER